MVVNHKQSATHQTIFAFKKLCPQISRAQELSDAVDTMQVLRAEVESSDC